ncbi:hypothetical protein PN36_30295 [Candidatus Thiomargarita nelsonii]|uniref:Protein kinase domain-containing protein n=1 Tax=Candidatus Thiomargarita nelsonii TaxID=1003181 RepID=A0A4E0QPA2_9GAMM|nr:hypothetical protein PN36_30295 [Candidatus Thiomargarita nelsonii]
MHDIGFYSIERLLGAGSMGCMFLCQNKNRLFEQERVVVRCFWETLKGDINEVFKELFAINKIASEFVPKMLDYGYTDKNHAYFVTEYIEDSVDGEAWLKKYGPMDLETSLDVGLQVAKALQLAHDNKIYHLNLKPANLLLKHTESGISVKITDFGLSQVASSVICGTSDYAPPEQRSFNSLSVLDAKNDVFAFGATMYHLCTQKRPHQFRERDLPDVQALRDLLCDCVEDEIENRPNSARELVSQLEKIVFEFETVTVNTVGEITHQEHKQAHYQTEDLGKGITLEMVYIPSGTFIMGSPETEKDRDSDESPQHEITIEPFYISKYPVTQAQWQAIMGDNPSNFKGDNRPVEKVSWDEAVKFCQRLSYKTGRIYSLPSEAQWEYACRAGTTTPFYFGETITTDLANYNGKYSYGSGSKGVYRKETTEVGSFPPNAFGLYDMHGNVWEWCADSWHDNYEGAPSDGSVWEKEKSRVVRGGSWYDEPRYARSADRYNYSSQDSHIGLRLVSFVALPLHKRCALLPFELSG